jgi:hypothetical protein
LVATYKWWINAVYTMYLQFLHIWIE